MGDLGLHVCEPPPRAPSQRPAAPRTRCALPHRPLNPVPSLAMLDLKWVSLTLQTTWPRCQTSGPFPTPVPEHKVSSRVVFGYLGLWLLHQRQYSSGQIAKEKRLLQAQCCGCPWARPPTLLVALLARGFFRYLVLFVYHHFFFQTRLSPG